MNVNSDDVTGSYHTVALIYVCVLSIIFTMVET